MTLAAALGCVCASAGGQELAAGRENVHPLARAEFELGAVEPEMRLERMILLLKPSARQTAELDRLLEAQQEQGAAEYHRWLTPGEFGARFGASRGDRERVAAWLTGRGFAVERGAAGGPTAAFIERVEHSSVFMDEFLRRCRETVKTQWIFVK